ncbi:MAG TPA: phage portal protein [Stellaceae bacterium]|nr:phage portal protein [Stellaceae bacterium]
MPDLSAAARVSDFALEPYRMTVAARTQNGLGADWFGPLTPLKPVAPPEVAGRQFDFPPGYNIIARPRAYEPIGFFELRALADAYDLIRTIIETRKDQLARLDWAVRPRDANAGRDPRVTPIEAFLHRPDGATSWDAWLRQLLEDLFVIDAPALWCERARDGRLLRLHPIDGASLKRVIDDWGRTPAPPLPAYQQILHGLPAVDYTTRDILYRPRNARVHKVYGFSPVEQILVTVNIALRRQVYQLQYYTEGNVPEALIGAPESWTPEQVEKFQLYWDGLYSGNTAQRRHAKFVPGGVAKTFIPTKEPELTGAADEWLARLCCFAFSVSPQPFVRMVNRATAETAQDQATAEGLAPIQNWVKQLVDDVLAAEFAAPDLEFRWRDDRAGDPAGVAQVATDYVKCGIKSVNEVRAELGLDPVVGGDAPMIQTAQGPVPLGTRAPAAAPLRRFNPNHYGPGPQGGQFAPRGEGGGTGSGATRMSTAGGASAPKPWEGQPHQKFREKIAALETGGEPKDGYATSVKEGGAGPALGRYQLTTSALKDAGWIDKNTGA